MLPSWQVGVGIPIPKRSTTIKIGKSRFTFLNKEVFELKVPYSTDELYLLKCCQSFMIALEQKSGLKNLWSEISELYPIIISRHLTDLIASFFQLLYSLPLPNAVYSAKFQVIDKQSVLKPNATPASLVSGILTVEQRKFCENSLHFLVTNVHPELVMDSLMQLLSVPNSLPWIKKICGNYLSRTLMRPLGVGIVIDRIIGNENSGLS
jgi:hypothetical protein